MVMHGHGHGGLDDLPLRYNPHLLKRMLGYARPYAWLLALSLVLTLLITGIQLAQPYLLKIAIDDYILGPKPFGELQKLVLLFLFLYSGGMLLFYLQFNLLMQTGQRIVYDIRRDLFAHLQTLPIAFFDRTPVGRLVTRVTNDTEALNEMYTGFLVDFFKDLFLLLGIVIVMFRMHRGLALITLSVIPPVLLIIILYRQYALPAFRELRRQLARINTFFAENIAGIRLIQVFLQQKKRSELFDGINMEHYLAGLREVKTFAVFRPAMDLVRSLGLTLLLWYGGRSMLEGVIPFGVLYAFITYLDHFFRPLGDMSERYSALQAAMASSERIFHLLDQQGESRPEEAGRLLPRQRITGSVEFKNVWFAYEKENWVLEDINFFLRAGEKVAIVGPTGAGKSSLGNLINRFYEIQKGEIKVDGINIRDFNLTDLRRQVGVVHQETILFSGTIKENITLNRLDLTRAELEQIAREANAYDFINSLPEKFDTPVGERGVNLSAGQRQLLAFARILAFKPAIFILDEATSHLDTFTEKLLQETLERVTAARTSLIIAHRLSTVRHADRIFLIREGRLTEIESFSSLLHNLDRYL